MSKKEKQKALRYANVRRFMAAVVATTMLSTSAMATPYQYLKLSNGNIVRFDLSLKDTNNKYKSAYTAALLQNNRNNFGEHIQAEGEDIPEAVDAVLNDPEADAKLLVPVIDPNTGAISYEELVEGQVDTSKLRSSLTELETIKANRENYTAASYNEFSQNIDTLITSAQTLLNTTGADQEDIDAKAGELNQLIIQLKDNLKFSVDITGLKERIELARPIANEENRWIYTSASFASSRIATVFENAENLYNEVLGEGTLEEPENPTNKTQSNIQTQTTQLRSSMNAVVMKDDQTLINDAITKIQNDISSLLSGITEAGVKLIVEEVVAHTITGIIVAVDPPQNDKFKVTLIKNEAIRDIDIQIEVTEFKTLESIEFVSGSVQTTWEKGYNLTEDDFPTLQVTARYNTNAGLVTETKTINEVDLIIPAGITDEVGENKSITISYTDNSITETTEFTITVVYSAEEQAVVDAMESFESYVETADFSIPIDRESDAEAYLTNLIESYLISEELFEGIAVEVNSLGNDEYEVVFKTQEGAFPHSITITAPVSEESERDLALIRLYAALDEAYPHLNQEDTYTVSTWEAFAAAVEAALTVQSGPDDYTVEQIEEAYFALNAAREGLVTKASVEQSLNEKLDLIEDYEASITSEDKIADAKAHYEDIIADEDITVTITETTEENVYTVILEKDGVYSTIEKLVTITQEVLDPKDEALAFLQQAVEAAQALSESEYITDSWAALADAVTAATDILEDSGSYDLEDITAATTAITDAIENLVTIEEVENELEEALEFIGNTTVPSEVANDQIESYLKEYYEDVLEGEGYTGIEATVEQFFNTIYKVKLTKLGIDSDLTYVIITKQTITLDRIVFDETSGPVVYDRTDDEEAAFDYTGWRIIPYYTDGARDAVAVTSEMLTSNNVNLKKVGIYSATIEYQGKTKIVTITVQYSAQEQEIIDARDTVASKTINIPFSDRNDPITWLEGKITELIATQSNVEFTVTALDTENAYEVTFNHIGTDLYEEKITVIAPIMAESSREKAVVELEAAIDEAKKILNDPSSVGEYTEESLEQLESKVNDAESLDKENSAVSSIIRATTEIIIAIEELASRELADQEDIDEAVSILGSINEIFWIRADEIDEDSVNTKISDVLAGYGITGVTVTRLQPAAEEKQYTLTLEKGEATGEVTIKIDLEIVPTISVDETEVSIEIDDDYQEDATGKVSSSVSPFWVEYSVTLEKGSLDYPDVKLVVEPSGSLEGLKVIWNDSATSESYNIITTGGVGSELGISLPETAEDITVYLVSTTKGTYNFNLALKNGDDVLATSDAITVIAAHTVADDLETALNEILQDYPDEHEDFYSEESWENLQDAIELAEVALETNIKADIEYALEELATAVEAMQTKVMIALETAKTAVTDYQVPAAIGDDLEDEEAKENAKVDAAKAKYEAGIAALTGTNGVTISSIEFDGELNKYVVTLSMPSQVNAPENDIVTVEVDITQSQWTLYSLTITNDPTETEYYEGAEINLAGIKISVVYRDDNPEAAAAGTDSKTVPITDADLSKIEIKTENPTAIAADEEANAPIYRDIEIGLIGEDSITDTFEILIDYSAAEQIVIDAKNDINDETFEIDYDILPETFEAATFVDSVKTNIKEELVEQINAFLEDNNYEDICIDGDLTAVSQTEYTLTITDGVDGHERLITIEVALTELAEDRLELGNTIVEYSGLKQSDYTLFSYNSFQAYMTAAKEAYATTGAASDYATETATLTEAKNTVLRPAGSINKFLLGATIDSVTLLKEDDYTAESWGDLQTVLIEVKGVYEAPGSIQVEIDSALVKLEKAIDELVAKPSDTALLEEEIQIIVGDDVEDSSRPIGRNLYETYYTSDSFNEIQGIAEIEQGIVTENDLGEGETRYLQSQIDEELIFLQQKNRPVGSKISDDENEYDGVLAFKTLDANGGAEIYGTVAWFEAEIAALNLKYVEGDYDPETWLESGIEDQLSDAEELVQNGASTTLFEADWAIKNIENAGELLDPSSDQDVIDGLVELIELANGTFEETVFSPDNFTGTEETFSNFIASDFTTESWNAFQAALLHAESLINIDDEGIVTSDALISELAAAATALEAAMEINTGTDTGLVTNNVNKSALEVKFAEAESLVEDDYEDIADGWDNFVTARELARVALEAPILQSKVDRALTALNITMTVEIEEDGETISGNLVVIWPDEIQDTEYTDYTELNDRYNRQLSRSDYGTTPNANEAWAAYNNSILRAETVLSAVTNKLPEAGKKSDVNTALAAVEEAIATLTGHQLSIGTTLMMLKTLYDIAVEYLEGDYHDETNETSSQRWEAFETAMVSAAAIIEREDDPTLVRSEVTIARTDLENAVDDLEALPIDDLQVTLDELILGLIGLDPDDYGINWAADVEPELTQIESISEFGSLRSQFNKAIEDITALTEAVTATVIDNATIKAELQELINGILGEIDYIETDYTSETWEPLAEKAEEYQAALDDDEFDLISQVRDAIEELEGLIDELMRMDIAEALEAYNEAMLDAEAYLDDSENYDTEDENGIWDAFIAAMYDDDIEWGKITISQLEERTEILLGAIAALSSIQKDPLFDDLEAVIAIAEDIVENDDYTSASRDLVQEIIDEAEELIDWDEHGATKPKQSAVDAITDKLKIAIGEEEPDGDYEYLLVIDRAATQAAIDEWDNIIAGYKKDVWEEDENGDSTFVRFAPLGVESDYSNWNVYTDALDSATWRDGYEIEPADPENDAYSDLKKSDIMNFYEETLADAIDGLIPNHVSLTSLNNAISYVNANYPPEDYNWDDEAQLVLDMATYAADAATYHAVQSQVNAARMALLDIVNYLAPNSEAAEAQKLILQALIGQVAGATVTDPNGTSVFVTALGKANDVIEDTGATPSRIKEEIESFKIIVAKALADDFTAPTIASTAWSDSTGEDVITVTFSEEVLTVEEDVNWSEKVILSLDGSATSVFELDPEATFDFNGENKTLTITFDDTLNVSGSSTISIAAGTIKDKVSYAGLTEGEISIEPSDVDTGNVATSALSSTFVVGNATLNQDYAVATSRTIIVMEASENLKSVTSSAAMTSLAKAFTILATNKYGESSSFNPTSVRVAGDTVTLTLPTEYAIIFTDQSVKVSYTQPSIDSTETKLETTDGRLVASIDDIAVDKGAITTQRFDIRGSVHDGDNNSLLEEIGSSNIKVYEYNGTATPGDLVPVGKFVEGGIFSTMSLNEGKYWLEVDVNGYYKNIVLVDIMRNYVENLEITLFSRTANQEITITNSNTDRTIAGYSYVIPTPDEVDVTHYVVRNTPPTTIVVPNGVTDITFYTVAPTAGPSTEGGAAPTSGYSITMQIDNESIAIADTDTWFMKVSYEAVGSVSAISNIEITYDENRNEFTIPEDVTEFTFTDDDKEMRAMYVEGAWEFVEVVRVEYNATDDITDISVDGITYDADSEEFLIPVNSDVIEFTFKDGTAEIRATYDDTTVEWSFVEVVRVAYVATNDVTDISVDGITYDAESEEFLIPANFAETEFTFNDGSKEMRATYDDDTGEWNFVGLSRAEYTAEGNIADISDERITYDNNEFVIPADVEMFTFTDNGVEMRAMYDAEAWAFDEIVRVAYEEPSQNITDISSSRITYDAESGEFLIPLDEDDSLAVTEFTFKDTDIEVRARYSAGSWSFVAITRTPYTITEGDEITSITGGVEYIIEDSEFIVPIAVFEFVFNEGNIDDGYTSRKAKYTDDSWSYEDVIRTSYVVSGGTTVEDISSSSVAYYAGTSEFIIPVTVTNLFTFKDGEKIMEATYNAETSLWSIVEKAAPSIPEVDLRFDLINRTDVDVEVSLGSGTLKATDIVSVLVPTVETTPPVIAGDDEETITVDGKTLVLGEDYTFEGGVLKILSEFLGAYPETAEIEFTVTFDDAAATEEKFEIRVVDSTQSEVDVESYAAFDSAIAHRRVDTINIIGDITIPSGMEITIPALKTVTVLGVEDEDGVMSSSTLTVARGATLRAEKDIVLEDTGAIVVRGSFIDSNVDIGITSDSTISLESGASVTIRNSELENCYNYSIAGVAAINDDMTLKADYKLDVAENSSLTIVDSTFTNNGTVTALGSGVSRGAIRSTGATILNNGTFNVVVLETTSTLASTAVRAGDTQIAALDQGNYYKIIVKDGAEDLETKYARITGGIGTITGDIAEIGRYSIPVNLTGLKNGVIYEVIKATPYTEAEGSVIEGLEHYGDDHVGDKVRVIDQPRYKPVLNNGSITLNLLSDEVELLGLALNLGERVDYANGGDFKAVRINEGEAPSLMTAYKLASTDPNTWDEYNGETGLTGVEDNLAFWHFTDSLNPEPAAIAGKDVIYVGVAPHSRTYIMDGGVDGEFNVLNVEVVESISKSNVEITIDGYEGDDLGNDVSFELTRTGSPTIILEYDENDDSVEYDSNNKFTLIDMADGDYEIRVIIDGYKDFHIPKQTVADNDEVEGNLNTVVVSGVTMKKLLLLETLVPDTSGYGGIINVEPSTAGVSYITAAENKGGAGFIIENTVGNSFTYKADAIEFDATYDDDAWSSELTVNGYATAIGKVLAVNPLLRAVPIGYIPSGITEVTSTTYTSAGANVSSNDVAIVNEGIKAYLNANTTDGTYDRHIEDKDALLGVIREVWAEEIRVAITGSGAGPTKEMYINAGFNGIIFGDVPVSDSNINAVNEALETYIGDAFDDQFTLTVGLIDAAISDILSIGPMYVPESIAVIDATTISLEFDDYFELNTTENMNKDAIMATIIVSDGSRINISGLEISNKIMSLKLSRPLVDGADISVTIPRATIRFSDESGKVNADIPEIRLSGELLADDVEIEISSLKQITIEFDRDVTIADGVNLTESIVLASGIEGLAISSISGDVTDTDGGTTLTLELNKMIYGTGNSITIPAGVFKFAAGNTSSQLIISDRLSGDAIGGDFAKVKAAAAGGALTFDEILACLPTSEQDLVKTSDVSDIEAALQADAEISGITTNLGIQAKLSDIIKNLGTTISLDKIQKAGSGLTASFNNTTKVLTITADPIIAGEIRINVPGNATLDDTGAANGIWRVTFNSNPPANSAAAMEAVSVTFEKIDKIVDIDAVSFKYFESESAEAEDGNRLYAAIKLKDLYKDWLDLLVTGIDANDIGDPENIKDFVNNFAIEVICGAINYNSYFALDGDDDIGDIVMSESGDTLHLWLYNELVEEFSSLSDVTINLQFNGITFASSTITNLTLTEEQVYTEPTAPIAPVAELATISTDEEAGKENIVIVENGDLVEEDVVTEEDKEAIEEEAVIEDEEAIEEEAVEDDEVVIEEEAVEDDEVVIEEEAVEDDEEVIEEEAVEEE